MKAKELVKLNELSMKSENLGTEFEKVVLAELLKYTRGVTKIIPPGQKETINAPTNKVITLIKPSIKSLEGIAIDGVYDVNKQTKLESTHPDFVAEVLPGKNFFGYNDDWKIHIEAKSTITGRFKFGQVKVDNIFIDDDSEAFKYLMWFAYRNVEYQFDRDRAIAEFNSLKRKFLDVFKITSGHDYRLIHAVPGSPVEWLILDDMVDLFSGHFNISPRGVLRYVFQGEDYFILEKVSKGGEIKMYSKEKVMRDKGAKITPFKKVEEATETAPSNLSAIFKAVKEIKSAINNKLAHDPNASVVVESGARRIANIVIQHGSGTAAIKRRPSRARELVAAGTTFDKLLDTLREEIKNVQT
jgi:hypothetical protein